MILERNAITGAGLRDLGVPPSWPLGAAVRPVGPLSLAQSLEQLVVGPDQVGGVAGGKLGVAARMQLAAGTPSRSMAITRVWVDSSNIRIPSSSLPGLHLHPADHERTAVPPRRCRAPPGPSPRR